MRLRYLSYLLPAALAFCMGAHAATITYNETTTASGSFNGVSFTDQMVFLTGIGDTSNVGGSGPSYHNNLTSSSVSIGGGTFYSFTQSGSVFDYQPHSAVGFEANQGDILDTIATPFATYNLSGNVDGTGGDLDNSGTAFSTSGGNFVISSITGPTRFYVSDANAASAPEPSSIALLGSGALGLAGVVRRRLLRS